MTHNVNINVLFATDTLDAISEQQKMSPASLSWIVNNCVLHALESGYQPPQRHKVLQHRNGTIGTDGRRVGHE